MVKRIVDFSFKTDHRDFRGRLVEMDSRRRDHGVVVVSLLVGGPEDEDRVGGHGVELENDESKRANEAQASL